MLDLHALFSEQGQKVLLKKGDYLLREGEVEHHVYWILSGAVRAVLLTENEELTIRFGYTQSIITAIDSFIHQTPSTIFIQAIRKTEALKVSRTDFYAFIEREQLQSAYVRLLEQLVTQQMEREYDLLTASPLGRLERVLERSPMLFQEIPSRYIASYLRMTPETLSRLMSKLPDAKS